MAERRLTCQPEFSGYCRARVVSFEQLGQEITAECGGSAVPEVTPLGRQMILGHLLRIHRDQLVFFKSIERQAGLAADLDATFDEMERSGKTADDLADFTRQLSRAGPLDVEGQSLFAKLSDLRLLYDSYLAYLGQERFDQHRRFEQVLNAVKTCSLLRKATLYVDGFFEFSDHERQMLAAIAEAGSKLEITLLMDPSDRLLLDARLPLDEMGLFHRTQKTYRQLWAAFMDRGIGIKPPVLLTATFRFDSPMLRRLERDMFPGAQAIAGKKVREPFPEDSDTLFPIKTHMPERGGAGDRGHDPDGAAGPPRILEAPGDIKHSGGIELMEAPDRTAEVDAIARRIRELLTHGYRLRDIAVLVRSLDAYHAIIATSFSEHGIPYFVDRRRTAAHHPVLQLLRGALQAARFDWNHDAIASCLKTGLANISLDEADELENYVVQHRVRGSQWESPDPWIWRRDLLRRGEDGQPVMDADVLRIDTLRRRVAHGLTPLVHKLRSGEALPLREIAREVFAMFERFNVRKTIGDWINAAEVQEHLGAGVSRLEEGEEHDQVWAKLIELFDQMVDLLGDQRVTPTDFVDIVESGLEKFDLAITPPTVDQVLVGAADCTRPPPVRAVLVMGLIEGEFPAVPRADRALRPRAPRAKPPAIGTRSRRATTVARRTPAGVCRVHPPVKLADSEPAVERFLEPTGDGVGLLDPGA